MFYIGLCAYRNKERETIEWKDWRSLQEHSRYQGDNSCKDGHNKGQKL